MVRYELQKEDFDAEIEKIIAKKKFDSAFHQQDCDSKDDCSENDTANRQKSIVSTADKGKGRVKLNQSEIIEMKEVLLEENTSEMVLS